MGTEKDIPTSALGSKQRQPLSSSAQLVNLHGSSDHAINEGQNMTTFFCSKCGQKMDPAAEIIRNSSGMPYHPHCFDHSPRPAAGQTFVAEVGAKLKQAVSPDWAGPQPAITGPQPAIQGVVVRDIHMPFGSMVSFMVKWAIASIPALLILILLGVLVFGFFGSCMAAGRGT